MYRGWIWAVFIAFDQLGNALCGGHPDITVSARLWHLDYTRDVRWMRWVRRAVDLAFLPSDGRGHCRAAHISEGGLSSLLEFHGLGGEVLEIHGVSFDKMQRGNDVTLFFLTWLVLVFVPVLFLVNCLRWLVGRFR